MIALVTGATGFLGRHVVKALDDMGVEVRCLVHTPGKEDVFGRTSVDVHYGSVSDPESISSALYNVDAVVHLVAVIRERGSSTFEAINHRGARNVARAAAQAGVKHLVHVGAIGSVEDARLPYLHSKWRGEQAVMESGVPYTIIRGSILFGPGDEFINSLAGLVKALPVATVAGNGRNKFQPIAVDEAAKCVALAVQRQGPLGETVEIGGPHHLSYNDIVDTICRTYRARRLRLHVPLFAMRPAVKLMEAVMSRPPVTTDQLGMVSLDNIAELGTVEKVFGFSPRPLEGNIGYIRDITAFEGLKMALGKMPKRIRDH